MRNSLIATVISLFTLVLSQPVKADSNFSYASAYETISTSTSDYYKNQEFRVYTLKWLEQDKGFPHKIAMSFCKSRSVGLSTSQLGNIHYNELEKRKTLEGWSESRFNAYLRIIVAGTLVGQQSYCPEFLGN